MFAHPRLEIYSFLLKVFGILKTFFQKGFKRSGRQSLPTYFFNFFNFFSKKGCKKEINVIYYVMVV